MSLRFSNSIFLNKNLTKCYCAHVVLIIRIIKIIINMDDKRQEKSNEGPTLKLNKRFK